MNKIVLIGAGSTQFGLGTIGDIFKSKVLEGSTIVLHDINPNSLENTKKISEKYKEELNVKCNILATTNLQEALKNANFCIISIEAGDRFKLWDQDWQIPLDFGLKQIMGENGGPGGLFHSLRIAPEIVKICDEIVKVCPDAFVFNYSNPMQRVCHSVTTKYPDLKFTGLCHEIASMERQLPTLMETDYSNIEIKAGGLNHFSILIDVKYKDTQKDGYPIIRKKFKEYYSTLVNDHEGFLSEPGAERGLFFNLYEKYNFLPITTDSHLGEYIQWAHKVVDQEAINHFYNNYKKKCMTYYENVSYSSFFDKNNKEMNERIVPIIEAIIEDSNIEEEAVNIPNKKFIDKVPDNIVVEVPGILNKNGVTGVKLENYPSSFGTLLNNQSGVIELTTEAVLKKSKQSAYLALLADPVVDDAVAAEKLLNKMLETQKDYLGYLN